MPLLPRVTRIPPSVRIAAISVILTFATCTISLAEPISFKTVGIAGTFNGWNTGDADFVLKQAGPRYELVRSWDCGTHEFKFVFDGAWTRHWGDGGGGKLVQPGGDIKLLIPQTGTYALWLDTNAAKWGLERRAPDKPIARVVVRDRDLGLCSVLLDGRLSEAGRGRQIKQFTWKALSTKHSKKQNTELVQVRPLDGDQAGLAVMTDFSEASHSIQLTVDDGQEQCTSTIRVTAKTAWDVRQDRSEESTHLALYPIENGFLGRIVMPHKWPVEFEPTFEPEFPSHFLSPPVPDAAAVNRRLPQLVAINPDSMDVFVLSSGFCEVRFDASGLSGGPLLEKIDVVGDFNGWRIGSTPMWPERIVPKPTTKPTTESAARTYVRVLELPNGVHHYKFVVNGSIWLNDPTADPKLTDADGNSGVRIGPDPVALGPVKPNDVIAKGLVHDPQQAEYFAPIGDDLAQVTIQTLTDDVQSVTMRMIESSADGNETLPLAKVDSHDGFDYWKAQIAGGRGEWSYWFEAVDGTARMRLTADGPGPADGPTTRPFKRALDMRFKTPDWAKTAVWYQIIPERFRNGDPSNDPPRTVPWKHAWDKPYAGKSTGGAEFEEKGTFFQFIYDRRYGGDLQGVREKLGYLRSLGVTAIYFNPMFEAESLHKYDASDYRHIDDFFGVKGSLKKLKGETEDSKTWQWSETDKLFLDFLKEAHRQGFRVVLDGVFNHVGRDFWAFRDVLKNGEKSKYAGWFDIVSFEPFHYKAWDKDDGALPRLKHDDKLGLAEPVREHLFAVTRRWMDPNGDGDSSDGIDGWRLDVAGDINVHFWSDWRKLVKQTNPDAFIVAELWQESRAWLDGKSFDAVMNYPFAVSAQKFFVNQKKATKPKAFMKDVKEMLGWYAPQVNHVLQNLFDSHDTDRLASMFLNPDLEYDKANRPQDNGPNYNTARPTADCYRKMKLAVTWQMTFLGAPMIYYGDEVGMFGADDPTDRKPMLWPDLLPYDDPDEKIEPGLLEHYQRMIAIRNTYKALRLGSFDSLMEDDRRNVLAFARRLGNQTLLVVLNNSDTTRKVHMASPWPDGADLVRVDDPSQAEVVTPEVSDLKSRPFVRPIPGKAGSLRSEKGVLWGVVLEPRTGAVIVSVPRDKKDK